MKQLLCVLVLSSLAMAATAQKGSAYLKGGLNIANVSINSNGDIDDANSLASFHVGFMGDLPIGKFFAIQPGLLFTGKGSKLQSGNSNSATYYKATTNPLYIELPVNAVLKLPLEHDAALYAGAGGYVAMGVAGKRKIEGKFLGASFNSKENIEFSNDDPTTFDYEEGSGLGVMKRFDYGVNFTAGMQLDKVLLAVNYGLGLAKLQSGSNSSDDKNNKNRVLSISLGFKL
jgi:Outer membrane protein beta-barrel domain